jgi:cysteine desulfurase
MKSHSPIYLDYAAATPLDARVKTVMDPYWSRMFYNPSATYLAAKRVAEDLGQARSQVASLLGARLNEIIFTAGGTEANNLAVHAVMQAHPGANVVVSNIEHDSILEPAKRYRYKACRVGADGRIDLADLIAKIDDKTVLVSIIYANNEIGTIQPIRDIAALLIQARQRRQSQGNKLPLYFHIDACQAASYLDLHVGRLKVDMMTLNGGKIYGPKQSGNLYVKTGTVLIPQIVGGGQEYNRRSGTENVAANVGMACALSLVQSRREFEVARLRTLQDYFLNLIADKLPNAFINGSLKHRLPNNVHLTLPGFDNERLMMQLDEAGIMCATGSACSASNEEPSHVLKAIGLSDSDAQASLRFTMGRTTTKADVTYVVKTLAQIVDKQ